MISFFYTEHCFSFMNLGVKVKENNLLRCWKTVFFSFLGVKYLNNFSASSKQILKTHLYAFYRCGN